MAPLDTLGIDSPVDETGQLIATILSFALAAAAVAYAAVLWRRERIWWPAVLLVGGTLAFNDLNLTPIARSIAPYPRNALDFERPLAIEFAHAMQMEIRLSASDLMLGSVPFRDVAAVVSAGGGVAKLDVGDAAVFGGRGQAAITIERADRAATARSVRRLGVFVMFTAPV